MVAHQNLDLTVEVRILTGQPNPPKADLILSKPNNATNRSIIGEAKDLRMSPKADFKGIGDTGGEITVLSIKYRKKR